MPPLAKPWVELTADVIDALPAQLGVYEIADDRQAVTRIAYAGGTEAFGMRTALERERVAGGRYFRHEFTHAYMTRSQELLMLFVSEHGAVPPGNTGHLGTLGRLSPGIGG